MSTNHQLLICPESLSESALVEILKSRCIELPNAKNLKKSDLIEMYRRIVLPMPQRRYNETKHLGKKLTDLRISRGISIATEEEQALYESIVSSQSELSTKSDHRKIRLANEDISPKKIRLTNSSDERNNPLENGLKRKCNDKETTTPMEGKKRQKISWP
ncbi:hypothetical protein TSAR_008317 [Trichomalopsis sarcophagae]|uniref:Uncharacterized protein n=1 Tax=Trichomalopsis sarcophagae TaxID=543379 RepID=A0A232FCY8_9HYME|nr:hypothetical protein TSAR_008317 [Trichomalopsis sarcophagae]